MADIWDEQEILSLVYSLTSDPPFEERDSWYGEWRDLLFQRRFVQIPGVTVDAAGNAKEGMVQFRSPEIEDSGHSFKNRMLASPIRIKVAARSKSDTAVAAAQSQQDFFRRMYENWRDRGVFDGILFDQATVGIGWARLSLNTDLLPIVPDYQEGDEDQFLQMSEEELKKFTSGEKSDLFVLEHIDPQTVYWTPDESIIIQKALVPLNPLIRQYGNKGKQISVSPKGDISVTTLEPGQNVEMPRAFWGRQITLYTVETAEYCYHAVFNSTAAQPTTTATGSVEPRGSVLGAYRNIFGRPAFFKVVGEQTGDPHPGRKYRSLLQGKYQTVPVKNILTTAMMTAGSEAAQQRYTLKYIGPPGMEDDAASKTVTINEDGVIIPPDNYEVVNAGLMVGPDLVGALKYITEIDSYGYPKSLNRPEEVSASSGYDRARQQDAVASLLDPPLGHFATMLTAVNQALKTAMVEIGEPITVRSVTPKTGTGIDVQSEATIKPEELKVETDISVSFNSITVFSRIAMEEEGMKQMQGDVMNETEYLQDVRGLDDVQAFYLQQSLDKVRKAARDQAVADTIKLVQKIAEQVDQKIITDNGLPNPMTMTGNGAIPAAAPPMMQTNGQMLRSDRGPGVPIGPGGAMPAGGPTPPAPAELGMPDTGGTVGMP